MDGLTAIDSNVGGSSVRFACCELPPIVPVIVAVVVVATGEVVRLKVAEDFPTETLTVAGVETAFTDEPSLIEIAPEDAPGVALRLMVPEAPLPPGTLPGEIDSNTISKGVTVTWPVFVTPP